MYLCDKLVINYFLEKFLKDVIYFKDFGVILIKDFLWGYYISIIVNKVNKVLGFIKCLVGIVNINVFFMLYMFLVWLILEYVVFVWCFYFVKDIYVFENV